MESHGPTRRACHPFGVPLRNYANKVAKILLTERWLSVRDRHLHHNAALLRDDRTFTVGRARCVKLRGVVRSVGRMLKGGRKLIRCSLVFVNFDLHIEMIRILLIPATWKLSFISREPLEKKRLEEWGAGCESRKMDPSSA